MVWVAGRIWLLALYKDRERADRDTLIYIVRTILLSRLYIASVFGFLYSSTTINSVKTFQWLKDTMVKKTVCEITLKNDRTEQDSNLRGKIPSDF